MGLTGILILNKPRGWTSHDAVAKVRRLSGQRRVGHAGTLDPLAEGVLPILLGRATRLMDLLQEGQKRYRAEVRLGTATSTDDAEGEVTAQRDVPLLSRAEVEAVLTRFTGTIQQVPPAYSALKVQGKRAYAIARGGGQVDLPARPVTIFALDLVDQADSRLTLDITCSKGTYIRSLARDLALALGTVGHLTHLIRTQVGPFALADAVTLEDLTADGVPAHLLPADAALPHAPAIHLTPTATHHFIQGQPLLLTELLAVPAIHAPAGPPKEAIAASRTTSGLTTEAFAEQVSPARLPQETVAERGPAPEFPKAAVAASRTTLGLPHEAAAERPTAAEPPKEAGAEGGTGAQSPKEAIADWGPSPEFAREAGAKGGTEAPPPKEAIADWGLSPQFPQEAGAKGGAGAQPPKKEEEILARERCERAATLEGPVRVYADSGELLGIGFPTATHLHPRIALWSDVTSA